MNAVCFFATDIHTHTTHKQIVIDLLLLHSRLHPRSRSALCTAVAAACVHCAVQIASYCRGSFNLYFAALVAARFAQKFYKKWGKAAIAGARQALAVSRDLARMRLQRQQQQSSCPLSSGKGWKRFAAVARAAATFSSTSSSSRGSSGSSSTQRPTAAVKHAAAAFKKAHRAPRTVPHARRRQLRLDRLALVVLVVGALISGSRWLLQSDFSVHKGHLSTAKDAVYSKVRSAAASGHAQLCAGLAAAGNGMNSSNVNSGSSWSSRLGCAISSAPALGVDSDALVIVQ
jgi:hypothetical protein